MVAIVIFVAALIVLNVAIRFFAVDSRDGKDWKARCLRGDSGCDGGF